MISGSVTYPHTHSPRNAFLENEKKYTRISAIYNQLKLKLLNSTDYKATLDSFNSKDIYKQLSPINQFKFNLFLQVNKEPGEYTTEDNKMALLRQITSLENSSKRLEGPPPAITASGRMSPRTEKFDGYTKDLSREGPENFKEPLYKKRKVTRKTPEPEIEENIGNPSSYQEPNSAIKAAYELDLTREERKNALEGLNIASAFDEI